MPLRREPFFSATYEGPEELVPESGSAYLFGTFEQRSQHSVDWMERCSDVRFVELVESADRSYIETKVEGFMRVGLRTLGQLRGLLNALGTQRLYIDFTGLSHHVWAPLIKLSLEQVDHVVAVYTEPEDYRFSLTPTRGEIFDLSERIEGIAPLPGFVRIVSARSEDVVFVPLLGFEGIRFSYVLEHTQPIGSNIFQ